MCFLFFNHRNLNKKKKKQLSVVSKPIYLKVLPIGTQVNYYDMEIPPL